jgi:hypothetical protein
MIISPTGLGIRNDKAGGGYYGAPRGDRRHKGLDFECVPGQEIYMPRGGTLAWEHRPYKDDLNYSGAFIICDDMEFKLFYFKPHPGLIEKYVATGGAIGIAQDISKKYDDDDMTPHVHLRIVSADPAIFLRKEWP